MKFKSNLVFSVALIKQSVYFIVKTALGTPTERKPWMSKKTVSNFSSDRTTKKTLNLSNSSNKVYSI